MIAAEPVKTTKINAASPMDHGTSRGFAAKRTPRNATPAASQRLRPMVSPRSNAAMTMVTIGRVKLTAVKSASGTREMAKKLAVKVMTESPTRKRCKRRCSM